MKFTAVVDSLNGCTYFRTCHNTYIYVVGSGSCAGFIFHRPLPEGDINHNASAVRNKQCRFVITTKEAYGQSAHKGKLSGIRSICKMTLTPVWVAGVVCKLIGMGDATAVGDAAALGDAAAHDVPPGGIPEDMQAIGTHREPIDDAGIALGAAAAGGGMVVGAAQAIEQTNPMQRLFFFKGDDLLNLFQAQPALQAADQR